MAAKKKAKAIREPAVTALATEIARRLFTNGNGERADRLVLMQQPKDGPSRDRGGWCELAVRDHIDDALHEALFPELAKQKGGRR